MKRFLVSFLIAMVVIDMEVCVGKYLLVEIDDATGMSKKVLQNDSL